MKNHVHCWEHKSGIGIHQKGAREFNKMPAVRLRCYCGDEEDIYLRIKLRGDHGNN